MITNSGFTVDIRPRMNNGFVLVAVIGVMVGAVVLIGPARSDSVEVVRSVGYELDTSPAAAAAFSGNEVIVLGTIRHLGQPRWNTPPRDGAMRMIFRPIQLDVEEVLKGDVEPRPIVVRHLGGQIDNVRYEFERSPALADVSEGVRVLLFLGQLRDTGDGVPARTPNMWYIVEGDLARSSDGRHEIDLGVFRSIIEQASM